MSVPNLAGWLQRVATPWQQLDMSSGAGATINAGGRWESAFILRGGSAPTTAAVPDNTTVGGLRQSNSGGTARLARIIASCATGATTGSFLIVDRLSHQGGLSGTTTGAQTTNLPTAALTRYTSGVGVWPCLEIYTTVGTTATTASISYTNQAGSSGQTSRSITFGSSGFNGGNLVLPLPLASGDTGCQAVASVTLAASTLTTGNFGVTLYKPLMFVPISVFNSWCFDGDALLSLLQPRTLQGSDCIMALWNTNANTQGAPCMNVHIAED